MYHHLWSETRLTGYSIGVIVRLESALDLVKKMERAKKRHWSNHAMKFPKTFKVGFVSIHTYFVNFVDQNLTNQMEVTGKMIKDTFEADFL